MIQPSVEHDLCGFVPHASQFRATILGQRELAHNTYAVRVHCPDLAKLITPGQFFMIRDVNGTDPMLGRPFALYDTILGDDGTPVEFEFGYHVVGKMTRLMADWKPGVEVNLWGPLGNGFPVYHGKHLLCVGGGIGYTPFFATIREALQLRNYGQVGQRTTQQEVPEVSLFYGVQSRKFRADLTDLEQLAGLKIAISTDDGSEGRKGFVTSLLEDSLRSNNPPDTVYCCGPEPMMHAVARICEQAGVKCYLSLETPMACGFGACFSCVTKVRDAASPEGWDYRRTCVEGPVFPASELYF